MAVEIERKFLVYKDLWEQVTLPKGDFLRQGYLFASPDKTIRVRETNDYGYITIKGKTEGFSRSEFEYEIPKTEASELLNRFCEQQIVKVRYEIIHQDNLWEIDVFEGENEGLIVAEIELNSEAEQFDLPSWIAQEVTQDAHYYNANLVKYPYKNWEK